MPRSLRRLVPCGVLLLIALLARPAAAQPVSHCSPGEATADLDANLVRARLYNTGGLFWRGTGNIYTVPKWGEADAVFVSNLWVAGYVEDTLRFAGTDYGPWQFWPGPLGDDGTPPADCAPFDRLYAISREALDAYEQTGTATADLRDWPAALGAPVVDGDGIAGNYDLAAGDRPRLYGDQTVWWVMNDAGNEKERPGSAPLGLEVQVTAYALRSGDALNATTFYRYKLVHKGPAPLEDAYVGFRVDPDLGNASDDYVGSDTLRHMAFVYNAFEIDQGFDGYGEKPPALGYVLLQGPQARPDGRDNDRDGTVDEAGERHGMTAFTCPWKGNNRFGNPRTTDEYYNCMRGLWREGTPISVGGSGHTDPEAPSTTFLYPADPPNFWSEENRDGQGARNEPADRRFLLSSGPFTLQPGESEEIVLAIVWSSGQSRLHSVERLKEDADFVHDFFQGQVAQQPAAPAPTAAPTLLEPAPNAALPPDPVDPDSFRPLRNVRFAWTPAGRLVFYRIQIATEPSFEALDTEASIPGQDQTQTDGRALGFHPVAHQRYYWRVRAENVSGVGPWSEARFFSVADMPIPAGFAVQGNYPNPFSGATTLVFDLPAFALVRLEVFDLLGRRVLVSQDATMTAGTRSLRIDASALPAGLYLYQFTARMEDVTMRDTGRMMVVK